MQSLVPLLVAGVEVQEPTTSPQVREAFTVVCISYDGMAVTGRSISAE